MASHEGVIKVNSIKRTLDELIEEDAAAEFVAVTALRLSEHDLLLVSGSETGGSNEEEEAGNRGSSCFCNNGRKSGRESSVSFFETETMNPSWLNERANFEANRRYDMEKESFSEASISDEALESLLGKDRNEMLASGPVGTVKRFGGGAGGTVKIAGGGCWKGETLLDSRKTSCCITLKSTPRNLR